MRRTARVLLTTIKPIPKSGRPANKSRDEHYCRSGSHHRGCNPAYVFQIPMYLKAAHNAFVRSHQHHDCHHRSGYDTIDDCTPESVSYTHLRAHETVLELVCRLLLEKKKKNIYHIHI